MHTITWTERTSRHHDGLLIATLLTGIGLFVGLLGGGYLGARLARSDLPAALLQRVQATTRSAATGLDAVHSWLAGAPATTISEDQTPQQPAPIMRERTLPREWTWQRSAISFDHMYRATPPAPRSPVQPALRN